MGTPDFAVPSLKMLIREGYEVAGVFCQPDRPKGRGKKLQACAVKEVASQAGIPVFQPVRIRTPENVETLRRLAPDVCITAAFGQILSKEVLDIPLYGTINVHASLLPKHRGSAPVPQSIIMGDKETGVTTMMTDVGLDTGDILLHARTRITENDTAGTLTEKLAELGAEVLMETLAALRNGTLERKPQEESRATYEAKLTKETGRIDWNAEGRTIDCLVRGTNPWPGAYTLLGEETMKIHAVRIKEKKSADAGYVVCADTKRGLLVSCADCDIEITELQMPGQRKMTAREYLAGHVIKTGTELGETANA